MARLWRVSRLEFTVAAIALVAVLLLGILKGVIVAAIASILLREKRCVSSFVISQPRRQSIWQEPGCFWSSMMNWPGVE
jgi:MFS superfamily sulfate permease-like transporter